jgi:hypothetical protein
MASVEQTKKAFYDEMKKKIPDRPFHLEFPPVETGGCSILLEGSGRCGKTTMLKHLMDNYFQKHCGAIFSQSAKCEAYKNMKYPLMPLSSVYIPELVNVAYRINRECKNAYPFLFVIDDVPLAKNDKELLKTLTIYRNSGISLIHGVQTPTLVNPTCRSNYTFFLLFHNNSSEQAENVCKQFLRGYFPSKVTMNDRVAWLQETTKDHHFIFIDNWNNTIQRCKLDLTE